MQMTTSGAISRPQYRLLRSRSLARRVIDELKLWDANDINPKGRSGALDSLAFWNYARAKSTPAASDSAETRSESMVIDQMLSHLNVVPIRDTRIIEIRYESPDPELAARVVNTLTSTYIKQNLEARSQALEGSGGVAWSTSWPSSVERWKPASWHCRSIVSGKIACRSKPARTSWSSA